MTHVCCSESTPPARHPPPATRHPPTHSPLMSSQLMSPTAEAKMSTPTSTRMGEVAMAGIWPNKGDRKVARKKRMAATTAAKPAGRGGRAGGGAG